MKGWQAILIATTVMVMLAIAVTAALPRHFRLERTVSVDAPIEAVWAQIGDLRAHAAWAPWITGDPAQVVTYGETTTGAGATSSWTGSDGAVGRYAIVAADPPRRIDYEVEFPGLGLSTGWIEAVREEEGTRLTWRFEGDSEGPLGGITAMMMDRLIGGTLDEGLAAVKALAEAAPAPVTPGTDPQQTRIGTDPGGALPPLP